MNLEDFQKDKPLARLCTFGIGGNAAYYTEVRTVEELQAAIKLCGRLDLPFFILGKGSNCLFSDEGFDGVIIHNKIDFITQLNPGVFHVGAGTSFSLLGAQTARQGWSGLEFASGIPASIGGAVFMNAGANGTETCEPLVSVDFVDLSGNKLVIEKKDLCFSYRSSSFQHLKGAIAGATFKLTPSPSARENQLRIVRYRKATQPYDHKSAGCIFRNPVCAHAGALIESCGLKGRKVGGAEVSTLHANFIVNTGQATAQDVLKLIEEIKTEVASRLGILLESEVRIVSNPSSESK